jgi:thiamine-monophosphate kinase
VSAVPRRPPAGEFELIRRFTNALPLSGEGVRVGVGDDAAVLAPPAGEELVATADAVVAGVHFDRAFAPEDVGWKALAVNLSDLAAMGARPLWALVCLGLPLDVRPAAVARIARGLGACAERYRVAIAGGNVTRASELSVTVTAIGAVPEGRALLRSGARAGDLVLVTGTLGDAALGRLPGAPAALVRRQRRPTPRLAAGRALAGVARAAIDVSDGLVQDLDHLCAASKVGARIGVADLPVSEAARRLARRGDGVREAALTGGEDYELVLAVAPALLPAALAAAAKARTPVSVIGRFVRGRGVRVVGPTGARIAVDVRGHDHLRTPTAL